MKQVLNEKYRPSKFGDVVGQGFSSKNINRDCQSRRYPDKVIGSARVHMGAQNHERQNLR